MMKKKVLWRMSGLTCLCLGLCTVIGLFVPERLVHAADQHLYASPSGTVNSTCSLAVPCTLEAARDKARTLDKSSGNVVINLRGGTYTLSDTFELTESASVHDSGYSSGGTTHYVIYQAYQSEVPVISGGQEITGWSLHDAGNNIYKANAGSLTSRSLYVNGVRAVRARGENNPAGFSWTSAGYTKSGAGIYGNMQNWINKDYIEVVYNHLWTSDRCGIAAISGNVITMKQPCWDNAQILFTMDSPSWIENAYELLDSAGEWYLDETGAVDSTSTPKIYYKAPNGETMSGKTVIAPKLEKLVTLTGTLDHPIHHIQFKNITFMHTTWLKPSSNEGYADVQAGFTIVGEGNAHFSGTREYWEKPIAAVTLSAGKHVRFERNTFTRLGSAGLNVEHGSQSNTIAGNTFKDISGSGVHIGGIREGDHHLAANLSGEAAVTASSELNGTYAAVKATDDQFFTEWRSTEQNPWIQLTWATGQTIDKIRIQDRPDAASNMNGGTLYFSDGSSIAVTGMPGDGEYNYKEISFSTKTGITWVKFQGSGGSGSNNGLSDFRVIRTDSRLLVKDNAAQNNYVTKVGVEYFDAVGIWAGYTESTTIAHNELHDLPYSAISIGWGWGKVDPGHEAQYVTPTTSLNNTISNNLIYDFMKVLYDGGGIYSLSAQPGQLISGNVIHDMKNPYGALYLDNRSRFNTLKRNIVYNNGLGKNIHLNNDYLDDVTIAYNYLDSEGQVDEFPQVSYIGNNYVHSHLNTLPASILRNAGLEDAYDDLHPSTPPAETTPPSAPTGLTAAARGAIVELNWTASTDNVGVTGYEIYQGSELIGVSGGTSFTVRGLGEDMTYSFSVKARDAAENLSGASSAANITTFAGVNLALNRPVHVYYMDGSPADVQPGRLRLHMTDGDDATYTQATGQYRWQGQVDLGSIKTINRIVVSMPSHTYATEFDIRVSEDGTNFSTVKSVTGFAGGTSDTRIASTFARYVRIVAVKPDGSGQTGGQMAISEIEVYFNLALNQTTAAYYMDGSPAAMHNGKPATNAVDGSMSTDSQATDQYRWQQEIDLGTVIRQISRIVTIMPTDAYHFATEFDIQLSTDGTNFTTVKSITGFTGGTSDVWVERTSARYVRIVAVKPDGPGQTGGQMTLSEVEVYGMSNIALNQTASAYYMDGSAATMHEGKPAVNGVDGDIDTDAQATNQYRWQEQVDLGSTKTIDRIVVKMPDDEYHFATEFRIAISTDGSSFTTIKTVYGFRGGAYDLNMSGATARYVRVIAVKPDGPDQIGGQMTISELEVY